MGLRTIPSRGIRKTYEWIEEQVNKDREKLKLLYNEQLDDAVL